MQGHVGTDQAEIQHYYQALEIPLQLALIPQNNLHSKKLLQNYRIYPLEIFDLNTFTFNLIKTHDTKKIVIPKMCITTTQGIATTTTPSYSTSMRAKQPRTSPP